MKDFSADFYQGQRWVSESEPELGLGSVLQINARTVTIEFKASDATRQYARNNAPWAACDSRLAPLFEAARMSRWSCNPSPNAMG
jgi:hypothetical protein